MRIGGLASGMNTDEIIRDLMKAQSIPLDKITQKKQYLEWQLNDYRSVNRDLKTTSDKLFNTVMMESSFMAKNVNISNPDAVGIKSINATSEFSGTISVHQLATQANWQSAVGTPNLSENEEISNLISGPITISASGKTKTLTFDSGTTIKSALERINKETGVNAFYDSHSGQIAMTAKNSGLSEIEVTGGLGGDGESGQNAEFTFNGLKTERSSNTFQINGFEINLKQVTAPFELDELTGEPIATVAAGGTSVTFNSSPDTDKVLDTVVKFVDDYNKMIEELNEKISEAKNRDFQPLSAEQKVEMKEKEIEQWEEKAMSGTLRNDPAIQKLLSGMRAALNGEVGEGGPRLSDIGITTASNWQDNGKLVIDETKLRQAITEEPNKVYEIFGKSGVTGENGKVDNTNAGLAVRLRAAVEEGVKSISARAGSAGDVNDRFTLGQSMKEMDNQIKRFQERLKTSEDRLWKQFAAMEMSIQRSNAQSAQLMSTFGGGM